MMTFRFKAMTAKGALVTGTTEAMSESAAMHQLRLKGYYPIFAKQADASVSSWTSQLRFSFGRSARRRDLTLVTQELATLLHAGVELDRAISILGSLGETGTMRGPLANVEAHIRDGANLADALAMERIFSKLYVNMVRAGELGGNLDTTLLRLGEYLGRAQALREAILSALIYPMILLLTAGSSIIIILIFVLPGFEPLFAEAGRTLPLATRAVMAIGHFFERFWWVLLTLTTAAVFGFRRGLARPEFRLRVDSVLLRLPLLGSVLTKINVERFSRTLGTLLLNGVDLPIALGITAETLTNSIIAKAVRETATSLREGEALASRLERTKLFPAMTVDLIRVGEESGRLDEVLLRQADLFERSVKQSVDRFLALLVPILTIVLGMIVAGLIASILIAILSINDLAI